ncbi:hypothetical protein MD484_g7176, partial [Candolleomyces efflorescens]
MQTNVASAISPRRRKPSLTYKSPTATEWATFYPQIPSPESSSQALTPPPAASKIKERVPRDTKAKASRCSFKTPLLPLYHPHGRLALSVPPLDPTSLGLPLLPLNYSESENGSGSRSSSRARLDRAAQSPGAEAISPGATTVSAVAAVAAREIKEKEKASPRRRRVGGKRKRKDNEDGDPTYPAKRTRVPRGHQAGEEPGMDEGEAANGEEQLQQEVERRTRSRRTGGKRSSSSGSETARNEDGTGAALDEKEEGELSDDGAGVY